MKSRYIYTALLLATAAHASAQTRPTHPDDPLVRDYWRCIVADSRNTARGERMDEVTLTACTTASDELQKRRFGGDFGKLHAWTTAMKRSMNAMK